MQVTEAYLEALSEDWTYKPLWSHVKFRTRSPAVGDRAIVNSASPTESCPILKPVNSTVSNQLLLVAVRYSDFSVNQHAINLNLTVSHVFRIGAWSWMPEIAAWRRCQDVCQVARALVTMVVVQQCFLEAHPWPVSGTCMFGCPSHDHIPSKSFWRWCQKLVACENIP